MSKGNSIERAKMIKAFGGTLELVDQCPDSIVGQVSGADLELVEIRAQELTKKYNGFRVDQFINDDNYKSSYNNCAPEIIAQLGDIKIDAFFDVMGTGGSLIGVSKALKEKYPDIKCYGVEPENASVYTNPNNPGNGKHVIQGTGYSQTLKFVEEHCELIDGFVTVGDDDTIKTERDLARYEGAFVGPSSGANVRAAINALKRDHKGKNILVVLPDTGTKYLSTDIWDIV